MIFRSCYLMLYCAHAVPVEYRINHLSHSFHVKYLAISHAYSYITECSSSLCWIDGDVSDANTKSTGMDTPLFLVRIWKAR